VENTERIFDLAVKVSEALGFEPRLVDIGGGLGIPYYPGEEELDLERLAIGVNNAVAEFVLRFPDARVAIEPGRYLVGPSGVYAIRARYVKESKGERFVITDGGTHQNMAAVGTGTYLKRNFPMALLSDTDRPVTGPCTVTGLLLTPTDTIGKNVELPEIAPGDVIGVFQTGAYGPSASITYMNGQGFPAEVLVHQGKAHLVRHRDTTEDLFTHQVLVDFDGPAGVDAAGADAVRAEIAIALDVAPESISDSARLFDDLSIDSLGIIDLLTRLEDRFGLVVEPEELHEGMFANVGSLIEYVLANAR
jgi:diaminopimelate decarboxylase